MTNQQTTGQNEVLNPDLSKDAVVIAAGKRSIVNVTPTVTAGAYLTGQVVGGILTFANALRFAGGSGRVERGLIICKPQFSNLMDLLLFSKLPTGTYTDNVALALTAADAALMLGCLHLKDVILTGTTILNILQSEQLPIAVFNNDTTVSTNLYGILVTRGGLTFAATSDLTVGLVTGQD